MNEHNPSIMSHVSIGTNDFARSVKFYDRVLSTVGARRVMQHPGAVAYGKQLPEFWVHTPLDGKPAQVGNGTHFGFSAASKQVVDAFYRAAMEAGANAEGPPGPREEYGAPYYGCFVRDPDGHKIEAAFWDSTLEK
jgi:catechol 2,3-dioxygenase-like lactoylglutathione lyase family enzyme